ncbi:hypothetical protein N7499_011145 [Penicillium canescens]|nr:hypothetical protein N7499_011145 [Penicillium canescens]KAJ6182693.1 hypothetical protein N7485_001335 [Penicillium canescens]
MAGGKKKKAADKKKAEADNKAEADRLRLQYQTATAAAMQQANARALQTRQATRARLANPNQAQPIQQPPIKQEPDVDESGEAEESPLNDDADSTDEESDWDGEEQEGNAPPGPKARPNRKNRGLVRWSDDVDIHLLLCLTYICQKDKVKLPWKNIAKKMCEQVPHTTTGAISQHLSKVRLARRGGSLEPPSPIRKPKNGGSTTERSETMTPKQVNKKSNKRARDATPETPEKRGKPGKKTSANAKNAVKGSTSTSRRAASNADGRIANTRLVNSSDRPENNFKETSPEAGEKLLCTGAAWLRSFGSDADNEDEEDELVNNANGYINDSEVTGTTTQSNIVRLRVPSIAAASTDSHPVTDYGSARISASQFAAGAAHVPASEWASGSGRTPATRATATPGRVIIGDYYPGHGNLGNDSLLSQRATPVSQGAVHLGLYPAAWSPSLGTSAPSESRYAVEHPYAPAASSVPGSWVDPNTTNAWMPWDYAPRPSLGPDAWLPFVAQRDAHRYPSANELAFRAEQELAATLGPRRPVVRPAEEITWKQEDEEEYSVPSPSHCKWFVPEGENQE